MKSIEEAVKKLEQQATRARAEAEEAEYKLNSGKVHLAFFERKIEECGFSIELQEITQSISYYTRSKDNATIAIHAYSDDGVAEIANLVGTKACFSREKKESASRIPFVFFHWEELNIEIQIDPVKDGIIGNL